MKTSSTHKDSFYFGGGVRGKDQRSARPRQTAPGRARPRQRFSRTVGRVPRQAAPEQNVDAPSRAKLGRARPRQAWEDLAWLG